MTTPDFVVVSSPWLLNRTGEQRWSLPRIPKGGHHISFAACRGFDLRSKDVEEGLHINSRGSANQRPFSRHINRTLQPRCRWKSGSPLFVRASLQFNTCYTDVGRVTSLGQVNPLDLLQESGYDDIVEVLEQSEKARDGG